MADKTVRVGIIGAGIWGTNHAPAFKENTDALVNRLLSKIAIQWRSVRLVKEIRAVQNGDTDT